MTVKVLMLKSGEDIIADVQEMVNADQQVIGYFLTKPVVVKLKTTGVPTEEELSASSLKQSDLSVSMYPWQPLAREKSIPLSTDWVVSMVTPVEQIQELYEKDVLNNGQETDSTSDSNEQLKAGLTD